ncbi:DNA methyltransferase [Micromonospora sp. WMMD729]|uniref:DNA methyltransferase n=1 Tax=Micromonospora sp. WMMD729 TaxID=3404127 RepID=UPI003BF51F3B
MTAKSYGDAVRRWEGVGPYYAMFPTAFADEIVRAYSRPGDVVLDPFAGRGTGVFSAAWQGRQAFGIEINPVGWIFGRTKLEPADFGSVSGRLEDVSAIGVDCGREADDLPEFFHRCFSPPVLRFLVAARQALKWREDVVDRTAMAILLVYLHGKRNASLSNQMRQTKAMAPDYAVRWWKERELDPPELDPLRFIKSRLAWRYAKGRPELTGSQMLLGDASEVLQEVGRMFRRDRKRARLLFTSPPYFALTNYHYDQWLRLWLMGGLPGAQRVPGSHRVQGKFENRKAYGELLSTVFSACAELLSDEGVAYVRTGAASVTLESTREALRKAFPGFEMSEIRQPYTKATQTSLFGDSSEKVGEVDLVLSRP